MTAPHIVVPSGMTRQERRSHEVIERLILDLTDAPMELLPNAEATGVQRQLIRVSREVGAVVPAPALLPGTPPLAATASAPAGAMRALRA